MKYINLGKMREWRDPAHVADYMGIGLCFAVGVKNSAHCDLDKVVAQHPGIVIVQRFPETVNNKYIQPNMHTLEYATKFHTLQPCLLQYIKEPA